MFVSKYIGEIKTVWELTKEGEEEHHENNRDGNWLRLCTVKRWGLRFHSCGNDHANTHAYATEDKQKLAAKAVDSPGGVESEEDGTGGVQGIDESNRVGALENLLIDDGTVRVECTLPCNLLPCVDDHRDVHPLADTLVFPQRGVATGDGLGLKFKSLSDLCDLGLHLLFAVTNSEQRVAGLLVTFAFLDEPSGRLWNKEDLR